MRAVRPQRLISASKIYITILVRLGYNNNTIYYNNIIYTDLPNVSLAYRNGIIDLMLSKLKTYNMGYIFIFYFQKASRYVKCYNL